MTTVFAQPMMFQICQTKEYSSNDLFYESEFKTNKTADFLKKNVWTYQTKCNSKQLQM